MPVDLTHPTVRNFMFNKKLRGNSLLSSYNDITHEKTRSYVNIG